MVEAESGRIKRTIPMFITGQEDLMTLLVMN